MNEPKGYSQTPEELAMAEQAKDAWPTATAAANRALMPNLRVSTVVQLLRKANARQLTQYSREQWLELRSLPSKDRNGDRLHQILDILLKLTPGQITLLRNRLP